MTLRLRPHHLLCVLTYRGEGYSPAFIENFDAIARRIGQGEAVEIVFGPDDICAPLLNGDDHHCTGESVSRRDALAAEELNNRLELDIAALKTVDLAAHLYRLREAFAEGEIRSACLGCDWQALCTGVASTDFRDTRLALR